MNVMRQSDGCSLDFAWFRNFFVVIALMPPWLVGVGFAVLPFFFFV